MIVYTSRKLKVKSRKHKGFLLSLLPLLTPINLCLKFVKFVAEAQEKVKKNLTHKSKQKFGNILIYNQKKLTAKELKSVLLV